MLWLIFWFLVFFPVALVLLATSGEFMVDSRTFAINYEGSKFWLCFWTLVFFPVAIVMVLLNGFSVRTAVA